MDNLTDKNKKDLFYELGGYNPLECLDTALTDGNFKFWRVDDKGNITYIPDGKVYITAEELTSENWLNHYLIKSDLHKGSTTAVKEFYSVYMYALHIAGFKSITIDIQCPRQIISADK